MPTLIPSGAGRALRTLVAFALASAVSAQSMDQGANCVGWHIERTNPSSIAPLGTWVSGDLVVRAHREMATVNAQGWLEVHRFDPHRDAYVLVEPRRFRVGIR